MQAAEKLFTTRRFHEITLDDIVQEAHVGKGTIYTYFKDKEDLFFQVATSGFDELCDLFRRRVHGDAPLREQLLQACEAVGAFFERRKHLFRMIQSEDARMSLCHGTSSEQWMGKRQQLVEALGQVLRKGQTEGKVRDDLPAETLATLLLGLLRTRARNLRKNAVRDDLLADFFLNGARRVDPVAVRAPVRPSAEREAQA